MDSAADQTVLPGRAVAALSLVEDGRAVGVDYGGQRVTARREVVLSAGAVGSPHLLMLSGIGTADQLREVGIEPVLDLPEVGHHLQDHLSVAVIRRCLRKVTLTGAESLPNVLRYLFLRRGPFTSNLGEAVIFTRTDPALAAPDIELIFAPTPFITHGLTPPTEHGVTLGVVLLRPGSRGGSRLHPPILVSLRRSIPATSPTRPI